GNKEKKGFHLVKWKSVITGKKNGGLGIKNLNLQSKALQMKWLWKYANGNQLLWERVIEAKYIPEDKWMTKEVTTPYGVSLWRSIRNLWDEVKNNSKVKVFDGRKTMFWKDNWHEKGNLEELFPDVYNLVTFQQGFIADLWTPQGWNFNFRRHLNDWEEKELGRTPIEPEVFKKTHVRKKENKSDPNVWVEERAERTFNDFHKYVAENLDSSVQLTPELSTQIWKEKVVGGTHKGRCYGLGSRNDVRRLQSGLEGIGSSRQAEALDGVQIAAMSDQITKLIAALPESERKRVAEQQSMSETVQQIKEQVMNLARRPTTSAPDDTDDESDEVDYVDLIP
ncbi:hypothetical protein MTR67_041904, partial [Solanum verrucosum]